MYVKWAICLISFFQLSGKWVRLLTLTACTDRVHIERKYIQSSLQLKKITFITFYDM